VVPDRSHTLAESANTDENLLIARVRELSADTLDTAIERGRILKVLNLKWTDYETKHVGITFHTGYRLITLVDHPRMQDETWQKPAHWYTCYLLLTLSDQIFSSMVAEGHVNYHTTQRQVKDYVRLYRQRHMSSTSVEPPKLAPPKGKWVNQVVCGDALNLIAQLDDNSINAVITSPPYAEQRKQQYGGISEDDYPVWFVSIMTALRSKLTEDGSVIVVIRPHITDGDVSDYVMRTVMAVKSAGWIQPGLQTWYKPDSPPMGSKFRFRSAHEEVLWFSKSRQPYVNLTAGGNSNSQRLGFESGYTRFGNELLDGASVGVSSGASRRTDVFVAGVSENEKGINHPAIYPVPLCVQFIESWSRPGDLILDPFAGSGSTLLAARFVGRNYVGFDQNQEYVDLARRRLDRSEYEPHKASIDVLWSE